MNEEFQISKPSGQGKIVHVRALTNTNAEKLLMHALQISSEALEKLFLIGAIYHNFKRIHRNQELYPQDILRIHQHPLRFETNFNWENRIVDNNSHFVIVDKPPALPTHATLDNSIENLKFQLEQFLNERLYTTHRLDVLTSGLIVFAKTLQYQAYFNKLLQNHNIVKLYTVKTEKPLVPGKYIHFMEPSPYSPKKISEIQNPKWLRCELEILTNNTIQLITGRTHQIRAQLAHLGFPLVGDKLYGGIDGEFYLRATQLSFDCALTLKQYCFKLNP